MERALEQWKSKEVARLLALVETERRYYQEMVANLPVSVVVLNSQRNLLAANRTFQQNYLMRGEDLRKRSIDQIFSSAELQARIQSVFESGIGSRPIVVERTAPGGGPAQRFRASVQAIRDWDEDSGLQALLVLEDLTDSLAEVERPIVEPPPAALAPTPESETAVTAVPMRPAAAAPMFPDPMPCVMWMAQGPGRTFTSVSPSAKVLLGIEPDEWIKTPSFFVERIDPQDRARTIAFYEQALSIPGLHSCDFRMRRSGVWYRETVLVEAGSDAITGVITDISARRAMEEQLLQAQRLEAVSHLAGRLAHDINNPLMIVNGYAEELAQAFPSNDPRSADMREIQVAGRRIGELTGHLQSVARRQTSAIGPVDVGTELTKVVERMRIAAGEYLKADYVPARQRLTVLADAGQLEAILLELSAVLVEGGGETAHLTLSASPHRVSEMIRADQPLLPGGYVELTVINQSSGPRLPARMFESLLPAKDPGREAGPALARAFRTIQEWGGTILTVPDNNEVRVYLKAAPVHGEPVRKTEPAARPASPTTAAVKSVEVPRKTNILIVEDEPGIRALMRKILQREGFDVLEAANGAEALEILQQKGGVSLLITDVLMPGMTGRELATQVQAMDPDCGILYMSGFTADTGVETGQFPPGSHFLQKPFTLGSLLRKANEVLASAPRRPV